MDEFINALQNFDINVIVPTLKRIQRHIESGYLTIEDRFFIDFCYPLVQSSCETQKLILKENKNGRFKKTN